MASRKERSCGGAAYGSPGPGPVVQSSMRAESRTLRLTTCPADRPPHPSPASGAIDTRDGLSPNRPHCAAGMRIEPPPSVACATGRMPAETAAAAPPEEPPGEYSRFQGLWQEPQRRGPGLGVRPDSGDEQRALCTGPGYLPRVRSAGSCAAAKTFY